MRGENPYSRKVRGRLYGSSPHARGKLGAVDVPDEAERFIPACAGKTFSKGRFLIPSTVHPRMRGENALRPSSTA